MNKIFQVVLVLSLSIFSINSYAQFGDLLKKKLEEAVDKSKKAAENVSDATNVKANSEKVTSTQTIIIRDLKARMPFNEAVSVIKKSFNDPSKEKERCVLLNLPVEHEYFEIGDKIIICENIYVYFNEVVPRFTAIFANDQLIQVSMLIEKKGAPNDQLAPDFWNALSEKYGVKPKFDIQKERGSSSIYTTFYGATGESVELIYNKSGMGFSGTVFNFLPPDFEAHVSSRKALKQDLANKKQQSQDKKAKSSL